MGVKSILVALNANGIFRFGKSGPCPLHVCHVIRWINLPISGVWRSYFWLEQSVNSTASLWLSLWLDELSLEKLLEILMYGLIVLESTVITWSVCCSTQKKMWSLEKFGPAHFAFIWRSKVIEFGRNGGVSVRNNPDSLENTLRVTRPQEVLYKQYHFILHCRCGFIKQLSVTEKQNSDSMSSDWR